MPYRYSDSGDLTAWGTTDGTSCDLTVTVDDIRFDPYTNTVYEFGTNKKVALLGEGVRKEMRGLYRVLAVDYKNDRVVVDEEVIANNEKGAELKALAGIVNDYDLDDLDIKAIKIMDVRKRKEVQRVRVVKE